MKDLKLTPQERGLKEEIKQFMQDNLFNNKLDTALLAKMKNVGKHSVKHHHY